MSNLSTMFPGGYSPATPLAARVLADPVQEFRQFITAAGLEAPDVIHDDGAIHRFSPSGRGSDKPAWYVLHMDGIPAGAFGDWRSGLQSTWCAKSDNAMTAAELADHRQRVKVMKAQRDAAEAAKHAAGATDAAKVWEKATPCTGHGYSERKGIKPHGARLIEADKARAISPSLSPALSGPLLVIPMRDTGGKLHSLQFIASDGTKRPVTGGNVKGCYYAIGKPAGRLIVCEGYATGASIHEATGDAVAVAFTSGNLEAVALALRAKYPALVLIVAADDDRLTEGNPGMTKAEQAAQAVGGAVAVPSFPAGRREQGHRFQRPAPVGRRWRGEVVHGCRYRVSSYRRKRNRPD